MNADIIRQKYLDFFRSRRHKVAESDSLVPKEDPTVLFTPAGMNQFKKQFLGMITDFSRAASSQRCLRTDDLDKVGKTDCHHTFFEMLGNFSFGDYFKEDAIIWAWEFLTREMGIKPEKLWVSVYKDDDEAYNIWKDRVNFPAKKIVRLGDKENFWPSDAKEKGPNGPCGPCSEIFFDLGTDVGCKKPECSPACSCGRFIEIWNLVFTQYNRKDNGALEPLPQKNIDTGMGLERIAAVMQGVTNNFQTDLFQPIIKEVLAGAEKRGHSNQDVYAVADHIRAIVFSIFDGIIPSNEGRGYVVRKLIRKSSMHLRTIGIKEPFLYKLVPIVAQVMKGHCPELTGRRENIADLVLAEEKNFWAILKSSDRFLKEKFGQSMALLDPAMSAEAVFELYDTHGLPFEIIMEWLEKHSFKFPAKAQELLDKRIEEQKSRSKSGSAMQGDVFSVKELELKDVPETKFLGYEKTETSARILKILKGDKEVNETSAGEDFRIVLDQTAFYAESGGQAGDKGKINSNVNSFEVFDTQKVNKVIVHTGRIKHGVLRKGDTVQAEVDKERRMSIARNHTATHLLQAALRKVLGAHVQQQGSLVAEDRLRFDFTHFKGISREELNRVEEVVNSFVISNALVAKKEMTLEEARKEGALAFFAEKYEESVRVVSVDGISKEFCGGTHLDNTATIGLFKIIHESSIASGIRRIEGLTGIFAYAKLKDEEATLKEVSELLKVPEDKLVEELDKRLKYIKELEKQLVAHRFNAVKSSVDDWIAEAQIMNGVKVLCKEIDGADNDLLRKAADLIKQKAPKVVMALGSKNSSGDGAALVTASNLPAVDAGALIKEIAPEIGGSGGGRKDFAQAGGNKPENLEKAFIKFAGSVEKLIGK
ncbi:MAG: alanine--tRNA ligase [Candidatus Omnitrophica bacterium]|nr:alanine--tRNA ligase [Candidatus Omnitrophota bacterium]